MDAVGLYRHGNAIAANGDGCSTFMDGLLLEVKALKADGRQATA